MPLKPAFVVRSAGFHEASVEVAVDGGAIGVAAASTELTLGDVAGEPMALTPPRSTSPRYWATIELISDIGDVTCR